MRRLWPALLALAPLHLHVRCDACGNAGRGPGMLSAEINGGAATATGPRLTFEVSAIGGQPPLEISVAEANADGDCVPAAGGGTWRPYAPPSTRYDVDVAPVDGPKKLCAWVRDRVGATSAIDPPSGVDGVNTDSIEYQAENLPWVEQLSVANGSSGPNAGTRLYQVGDPVLVGWTVADQEGLAPSPVDLFYTTAEPSLDQWTPIVTGWGRSGGATRYQDQYAAFAAPTAAPFRIKLVPTDAAGNRGIAAISDVQNAPGWSVYAGSVDLAAGSSALAARLWYSWSGISGAFTVDPVTQDLYASVHYDGILRVDARTGVAERVFWDGPRNLPDDGPLGSRPAFDRMAAIHFGPDGKLYLVENGDSSTRSVSNVIYQVDVRNRWVRRYAGGGTAFDANATPATVFVLGSTFDIDEDGTLYFLTSCTPGTWNQLTTGVRMMKVAQNPDGSPGAVSVVAGNCARGAPPSPGPSDPLAVSLGDLPEPDIGTIAAFGRGRYVYYASYNTGVWKLLDGKLYASDVVVDSASAELTYGAATGRIYAANGGVTPFTPNLTGANGDVPGPELVSAAGTHAGCTTDGVPAAEACVNAYFTMRELRDGTLLFMDGPSMNGQRPYRIRFVDPSGNVGTRAGAASFHQAGLDRRVLRSRFAGIHYKAAGDPNQAAFPEGLYFLDGEALVFGRIDPATGLAEVQWGNQSSAPVAVTTGTPMSPDLSLGVDYLGNAMVLAFDAAGLPWLRFGPNPYRTWAYLVTVDASRAVKVLQEGSNNWERAADGADPYALELWPYGCWQNLALAGSAAFVIGGHSGYVSGPTLKVLDFGARTTLNLMGRNNASGFTADTATPGAQRTATLASSCLDTGACPLAYRPDQDRLYFAENNRIRYLTSPATPASATLGTLWTASGGAWFDNLTFEPGGTQLFYLRAGRLFCHDLSSGKPWCNDTDLGPPASMASVANGPNQFTWKDARTLLLSTYRGEIHQFDLPP